MKKSIPISYLLFFVVAIFILGCSPTKNISQNKKDASPYAENEIQPNKKRTTDSTWSNILRGVPGLDVRGADPNLSVTIRGANSITGTNQPLFVLDGVPLGHSFSSLAQAIRPQEVDNIRVLKGPQATRYGARGSNGVIEVKSLK